MQLLRRSQLFSFTLGLCLGLVTVSVIAQTVRSNATQFASINIETNGSSGAPSLRWTTDATGFYRIALNQIGVTAALIPGTTGVYDLGSSSNKFRNLYLTGSVTVPSYTFADGNYGAPSITFTNAATLGFYNWGAANNIGEHGNIVPGADATWNIGATANRFAAGMFSGNVTALTATLGWNATAANNVLLDSIYAQSAGSYGAGMGGVRLGDNTGYGDWVVRHLAGGRNPQPDLVAGSTNFEHNLRSQTVALGALVASYANLNAELTLNPSANETVSIFGIYSLLEPNGTHNYSGGDYAALYGANYAATSGTLTDLTGVTGDAEALGTGNITNLFAFKGICCSVTPAMGTSSTVTRSGFIHLTQPFTSAVPPVTHAAIWIEDQTAAGTFVPSSANYLLKLDAPSSKTSLVTAAGLAGLYGATPTSTAPLKVGGTIASTRVDDGNSGTADTLDLSTGNVRKSTLTGNVTYTLSNPADGATYQIEIFTGAGGFTATWPATVKWPAGTAPTITATAGRVDLIELTYDSTSGDYFGRFWQNYTP